MISGVYSFIFVAFFCGGFYSALIVSIFIISLLL